MNTTQTAEAIMRLFKQSYLPPAETFTIRNEIERLILACEPPPPLSDLWEPEFQERTGMWGVLQPSTGKRDGVWPGEEGAREWCDQKNGVVSTTPRGGASIPIGPGGEPQPTQEDIQWVSTGPQPPAPVMTEEPPCGPSEPPAAPVTAEWAADWCDGKPNPPAQWGFQPWKEGWMLVSPEGGLTGPLYLSEDEICDECERLNGTTSAATAELNPENIDPALVPDGWRFLREGEPAEGRETRFWMTDRWTHSRVKVHPSNHRLTYITRK